MLPDRALCARCSAHACSPSTFVVRIEPAPQSRERPSRAIQRRLRPPRGRRRQRRKDASHRPLQPTYSTSTGATARFPPLERLATPSTQVEIRLTPSLQLQAGLRHSLATMREGGAPHRSSAALCRRSRPNTALEAQPSDAFCPALAAEDRCRRAPVKGRAATGPRRLPSTGVPFAACASQETRHLTRGFAAAGSASDASPFYSVGRGSAFAISFRRRLNDSTREASRAHRPSAGQVWRRLSTSAITTVLQHKPRSDRPPRASSRELPPCAMDAGGPAPLGARPAKLSPSQGPPRT